MASSALSVRPGVERDVPDIVRMILGLAEYERLTHVTDCDPERIRRHLFGEPRYAETLLAEVHGDVVGMALFFHSYSTFHANPGVWLEDLFVVPEHRGHGIGRALLAQLSALAVERGCARVEWSVLDWTSPPSLSIATWAPASSRIGGSVGWMARRSREWPGRASREEQQQVAHAHLIPRSKKALQALGHLSDPVGRYRLVADKHHTPVLSPFLPPALHEARNGTHVVAHQRPRVVQGRRQDLLVRLVDVPPVSPLAHGQRIGTAPPQ